MVKEKGKKREEKRGEEGKRWRRKDELKWSFKVSCSARGES